MYVCLIPIFNLLNSGALLCSIGQMQQQSIQILGREYRGRGWRWRWSQKLRNRYHVQLRKPELRVWCGGVLASKEGRWRQTQMRGRIVGCRRIGWLSNTPLSTASTPAAKDSSNPLPLPVPLIPCFHPTQSSSNTVSLADSQPRVTSSLTQRESA